MKFKQNSFVFIVIVIELQIDILGQFNLMVGIFFVNCYILLLLLIVENFYLVLCIVFLGVL